MTSVLPGLDALLTHMDKLETWADGRLEGALKVLLQRLRADVELSIEAMLSDAHGLVADASRDLMEVEFLLRDFGADHGRAGSWMTADRKTLVRDFGPAAVRAREAMRQFPDGSMSLPDESEYQVHSQVTHPTPHGGRVKEIATGAASRPLPFTIRELLEHTVRCLLALDPLLDQTAPPVDSLAPFHVAYMASRQYVDQVLSLLPADALPERRPTPKTQPLHLPCS